MHIVNVAIRYDTQEDDDAYAAAFEEFCAEKVEICVSDIVFKYPARVVKESVTVMGKAQIESCT